MTRLYFEPITVQCDGDCVSTFIWRRRVHPVTAVLKHWIVQVGWWRQEVSRQYYKVQCENLGVYEIYCERGGRHCVRSRQAQWFLERLYD